VCGFLQWIPTGAPMMLRTKASVHRSLVSSNLGGVAIDMTAHSAEDLTQAKFDEELAYYQRTSGRQLDGTEAEEKVGQEKRRKEVCAHDIRDKIYFRAVPRCGVSLIVCELGRISRQSENCRATHMRSTKPCRSMEPISLDLTLGTRFISRSATLPTCSR